MADLGFDGKVAIVTGAGGGLGRSHALELAHRGARVVINDLGGSVDGSGHAEGPAAAVVREINDLGGEAVANADSVATPEGGAAIVASAIDAFGRVDIVVNNAAMSPGTLLHESSPLLFEKTYATNTLGPMLLASRCAERMRDAGGGVIINVVTTGAFRPGAGLGLYCSSKAALHALTLVMAKEWATWGVRVNEIAPGPFLTDMMAPGAANPEFTARMYDSMLIKRIADPTEIVGAALYLASDASGFATGTTVTVDGGISA